MSKQHIFSTLVYSAFSWSLKIGLVLFSWSINHTYTGVLVLLQAGEYLAHKWFTHTLKKELTREREAFIKKASEEQGTKQVTGMVLTPDELAELEMLLSDDNDIIIPTNNKEDKKVH